jgi:hypothetical protein
VRRIGRYILNGLAVLSLVLSLVLSVAVAALWLRSYRVDDEVAYYPRGTGSRSWPNPVAD